jgi:hypothetical protein
MLTEYFTGSLPHGMFFMFSQSGLSTATSRPAPLSDYKQRHTHHSCIDSKA